MKVPKVGLLLVLLGLAGCSDEGTAPTGPPDDNGTTAPAYAADVQPIWNANCTGCHGAGGNGGLDLRASAGPAALVNVAASSYAGSRVVPGDPQSSVLYLKLEGDPSAGQRMPQGGALSTAELTIIHDWIVAGALDN